MLWWLLHAPRAFLTGSDQPRLPQVFWLLPPLPFKILTLQLLDKEHIGGAKVEPGLVAAATAGTVEGELRREQPL